MLKWSHRSITEQALGRAFSAPALEMVIAANLGQDNLLTGQVGHPEYHFDDNAFTESRVYMGSQRALVVAALKAADGASARRAFGRLTHAAQDFYAHSNYVRLWLGRFSQAAWPEPEEIDPFGDTLLDNPELRSGKLYYPLEVLSFIPGIKDWIIPRLPVDSHARMNLDAPDRGPEYAYAFTVAVKRTRWEYDDLIQQLPPESVFLLSGLSTDQVKV
ncbi:MAG: hypothetical protein ABIJ39_14265 [Chloroflexota bacterium]